MIVVITTSTLIFVSGSYANAETETLIEPTQLSVSGVHGTIETRNIFLRTATPIKKFQLISLDLNRADGNVVLPMQAISLQKTSVSKSKPNELNILVDFNLRKVPTSGEFSGKLRLSYEDGEQIIPVTVKVKDTWLPPFIILLFGTGLGMLVSIYRAQGRPRDEVLVRVSQLRVQMQDDRNFENVQQKVLNLQGVQAFQSKVEAQLVDVKMALQAENWEEAQNAVKQAEKLWSKWLKQRVDWSAQLTYLEQLKERLQDLDPSLTYVQTLNRYLEDAIRDAPDLESPNKLRDRLEDLASQINSYYQLKDKIKHLKKLQDYLPNDQTITWQSRIQYIEERVRKLQPSDLTKDTNLQADTDAAIDEITKLVSQDSDTGVTAKGLPQQGSTLIPPAPSVSVSQIEKKLEQKSIFGAKKRLQAFKLISYGIAVVFLAGVGFNQLYNDQPTFGADPWKDYFALLAWGFGAEATRDAVTKVIQGWELPGLK
ncbi:MAG: hypothetical protein KI793_32950 [Rivularia sp. (in: Bacteria)]|nr:hypothetical protein [Rivularia sp. MS3]